MGIVPGTIPASTIKLPPQPTQADSQPLTEDWVWLIKLFQAETHHPTLQAVLLGEGGRGGREGGRGGREGRREGGREGEYGEDRGTEEGRERRGGREGEEERKGGRVGKEG